MSNGRTRTLDEFGWNGSLSPSAQWTVTQSALSTREPLALPAGETVKIDQPLVMTGGSLTGAGGDLKQGGLRTAVSQLEQMTGTADTLKVEGDHCYVAGFDVYRGVMGQSGRGIVVGRPTDHVRGFVLDRVTTHMNNWTGLDITGAGGFVLDRSWLWGYHAGMQLANTIQSDTGDNKITNCDLCAAQDGVGLRWLSGGGLYITGSKFQAGQKHIDINWTAGNSANFSLIGCSLEGCTYISMDLYGSTVLQRVQIVGNTWGVPSACIAVRNFCPNNFLQDITIVGNTMQTVGNAPIMDLGNLSRFVVSHNALYGTNLSPYGIIVRPEATDGYIGPNMIRGCTQGILNQSSTTTVAAQP